MTKPHYVLAGIPDGRAWPLHLDGRSDAECRSSIRWQEKGGARRDEFAVAVFDKETDEFVDVDAGRRWPRAQLDIGPYTRQAFDGFIKGFGR